MLHTHYDYYLLKEHGTVFFLTTNQLQPAYQPQKPSAVFFVCFTIIHQNKKKIKAKSGSALAT